MTLLFKNWLMSTQAMTQIIAEYFKTQPVLKAWLFGSYSRGEERPDSDVDILVALDREKPIGIRFFGMWGDLERLLHKEVDLVTEGSLMPYAADSANRDKILIYERTAERQGTA
jgi:predicted nucleotidyltransferase